MYEFFRKYYLHWDKLYAANQAWALMVTPGMAASSAQSFHDRHGAYARMCVVAFWRHMPTVERYELARARGIAVDSRKWGGTFFAVPAVTAATGLETRCLGIDDLVDAFEGPRRREMRWRRREGSRARWRGKRGPRACRPCTGCRMHSHVFDCHFSSPSRVQAIRKEEVKAYRKIPRQEERVAEAKVA